MAIDPRSYLWANICRLMGEDNPSLDAAKAATGIGRGTVQRMRDGDTDIRLLSILGAADKLGVEVWELLMPPDVDHLAVIDAAVKRKRQEDAASQPPLAKTGRVSTGFMDRPAKAPSTKKRAIR